MFCYTYLLLRKKINDSPTVTIKFFLIFSQFDFKFLKGRKHVFYLSHFIHYLAQGNMLAEYLQDEYTDTNCSSFEGRLDL